MSWTIYYLSGCTNYWYFRNNDSKVTLVQNPLSGGNAHGFQPNLIDNLDDLARLNLSKLFNNDIGCVIYMHPWWVPKDYDNPSDRAIDYLVSNTSKHIVISSHKYPFYKLTPRMLSLKFCNREVRNSNYQELFEDLFSYFYPKDLQRWKEMMLQEIWDQREFLALNLRPHDVPTSIKKFLPVKLDQNYFFLDAGEIWLMFDSLVHDIMSWLDIKIDKVRYQSWLKVYDVWKTYHQKSIRFNWYFDEIIYSIIHDRFIDLGRFDLDLIHESVIQHELIYKHDLNFKTWELTKFQDTHQLHLLLESNIHNIENIYKIDKSATR